MILSQVAVSIQVAKNTQKIEQISYASCPASLLRSGRSNEPEGRDRVPESNEVENVFDDVERRCECRPVCNGNP